MVGGVAGFTASPFLDRDIMRLSKQNIRRLMDRWPAMVRSAGRFPSLPERRMTRAGAPAKCSA